MADNDPKRFIRGPFRADPLGGMIWTADDLHFADVRGWGFLSRFSDADAVMDTHLQFIADALNEKLQREEFTQKQASGDLRLPLPSVEIVGPDPDGFFHAQIPGQKPHTSRRAQQAVAYALKDYAEHLAR